MQTWYVTYYNYKNNGSDCADAEGNTVSYGSPAKEVLA